MQIERIRPYPHSSYQAAIADKAVREEKGTLLDDAVSLDTERREQKDHKHEAGAEEGANKEAQTKQAHPPGRAEPAPLNIVA